MKSDENRGLLITVAATFCAASVPILSKAVLVYASSPMALMLRMFCATIILFLIIKLWLKIKIKVNRASLLIAFFGALNFSFFILGIKFMPTVFAPVFYSSVPIQTTIIAWLLFRNTIGKLAFIGILVGFAGNLVILSDSFYNSNNHTGVNIWGIVFLAIASLSITLYGLLIDRYRKSLPSGFSVTFQAILMAFIFSIPIGFIYPDTFIFNKSLELNFWLSLLALAVVGTVMQYVLYQKSIQIVGKLATVIFFYLQPVFVVLLSAVFLTENINWIAYIIGMLLILTGSSLNLELVRQKITNLRNALG